MLVADPDREGAARAVDPKVVIAADGSLLWSWSEFDADGSSQRMMLRLDAENEPELPLTPEVASSDADGPVDGTLNPTLVTPSRTNFSPKRAALARRVCADGVVLLKNDGALPLSSGSSVAVFGPVGGEWLSCGGMSARVNPHYTIDVVDGLRDVGLQVADNSRETAVFVMTRTCGRGGEPDLGAYAMKDEERSELARIKSLGFKRIVVVLNNGVAIATRELASDPAVSAVLMVGFPGMEGGRAVADILTGAVNPSGRLTQTLAQKASDYPADANWQEALHYVPYEDDIYLGYRYFETIPGAKEKVVYPFGHGLSYTTWDVRDDGWEIGDGNIEVKVRVTNTGKTAGRNSVLVYTGVEGGKAEHPARELRGFAKTRLLAPSESETVTVKFAKRDLAYFDDEGASGCIGSWVVDGGRYTIYVGGSVRDAKSIGSFDLPEEILATPGFKLNPAMLARRLRRDGSCTERPVRYGDRNGQPGKVEYPRRGGARRIMLRNVAEGRNTLDEFIEQLSAKEIAAFLCGKENLFIYGDTGSFCILEDYGVPGLQTADGPLGLRIDGIPTTQFPGTDILAGTFDVKLAEEVGRALAEESKLNGIDVLLAPGVNLNRHPVCARNFEYMGEDPVLAGKMGAAIVRGVQAGDVFATIKHFFAANRINALTHFMNVMSERAAREIYLKPFEIALSCSRPDCVMTAYNGTNGRFAGANNGAIDGILREEWGYDGVVMTDWGALSQLWAEVSAGNDVKMPDDGGGAARLAKSMEDGTVDRAKVYASVKRVLRLVMKSNRFKSREMRRTHGADAEAGRPAVVAIYYPHWHVYPKGNEWFHPGWTEWEFVKTSKSRFQGHTQPLVPTPGFLDGANPDDVAKEIDLAADAGIDAFLYDYPDVFWISTIS